LKYAWVAYTCFLVAIGIGRLVQKILLDGGGFASRYLPLLVAIVLAIGVMGQVYQKKIARAWFWQSVLWLSVAASTLTIALCLYLALMVGTITTAAVLLIFVIVILPAQMQIWHYSYRSAGIWGAT